jgi:VCBS repeat-containing protein
VQVDKTAPTATLSTSLSLANPTNAATLPIHLNFSEAVDGLTLGDLTIGNGTASNLLGSGSSYTFDVTPTSDGAVTIGLNASTVTDLAGNSNPMSATLSIASDRTAPAAPIVSDPSGNSLTNSGSVTIDGSADAGSLVRLYRDVDASGTLSEGDAQVGQQQLGGSETSFSFNAELTADVANHFLLTATDSATNESVASAVPTITQDSTRPSASIAFGVTNPTNATSIPVTVNFSEPVSGFESSDVSVGNGSISDFVSVSSTQATFNVTPAADGNVTIDIAGGAAVDLAGNLSNAATQASIVSDTTKPTASFTASIDGVSNVSVVGVTVAFSESVPGFDLSALSITNGSASDLTSSGSTYSFNLTPAGDGEVIVSLAAGSVSDAAGNTIDATELHIRSDRTAPSAPSISSPAADVATNATTFNIAGTISPVEDTLVRVYRDGDNSLVGEQLLLGGDSFSISVPLTANSTNRFSVTSTDAVGNVSVATTTSVITQDSVVPQTSISISCGAFTNAATIAVAVSFTESVVGFDANDVSVSNGTVSDFVAVDGAHYTLTVTPNDDGLVTIDVAAGVAADAAVNGNEAATQRSFVSDRTAPVITLTPSVAKNGNGWNNTDVTVSYSVVEANIDADASDSADDLLTESGTASATVTDLAGNSTTVSYSTLIDKVAPTLTATRDKSANENGWNNSDVTVTFEASDDLSGGVSSPAAQVFTDGFDQTASATVTDLAGNSTTVSIKHINVDKVAPTLTASRDLVANSNGWNNSDVTVTFEASDALSGGVSSPATQVFGEGFDQTASATVTDLAGNSTSVSIEHINVDKTAPAITVVVGPTSGQEGSELHFELQVFDGLSGKSSEGWTTSGGPLTIGSDGGSALTFTPLDNGSYEAAYSVTDAAGNSASFTQAINVANLEPTAGNDSIAFTGEAGDDSVSLIYEDDLLEGECLLDNDSDPAGTHDPLTVIGYDAISKHGAAVTVESDGRFTYDPRVSEDAQSLGAGEVGIDTFDYTISDGDGGTSHATVSVEVHGVNDAPVLNDTSAVRLEAIDANDIYGRGVDIETFALDRIDEVDSNDTIGIAVIGFSRATTRGDWQFSTNNGHSWTTINTIGESHALHLVADGHTRLRLRPDGSHTGTARLTLRAWDGSNGISNGGYAAITGTAGTAPYSSEMLTVRQTVLTAAKDATIAVSDTFDVGANGEVSGNVLANDIDPDSRLPQDVGVHFAGNLELGLLGQLFGAPGDVPTVALTHYGALTHNIDGSFTYEAEPNFFASLPEGESVLDGFTYFVTDGKLTSNVAGVSLVLTGVNDAPEVTSKIEDQVASVGEEFGIAVPEFYFHDVDNGDSLTITVTKADGSALPSWLEADEASDLDVNYLTLTGTPSASDVGIITVRVTATDSHGASTSTYFALEVINVNHAPTAGILDDVSVNEGDTLSLTLPADLFYDPDDGDHLSLSVSDIDGNSLPNFFAFNAESGTLTATPSWDAAGVYTVVVTATDLAGESASTTFNVNVIDSLITIHVVGQAIDPNEAWSLFADGQGFLHITRNGGDAIEPLPLEEVFAVYLDTGDGDDTVTLAASLNGADKGSGSNNNESDDNGGLFINLGAGNDSVDGTAVNFSVIVFGGDGNDLLLGGSGNDFLSGEAGNDTLRAAGGDDLLLGGDGQDTLRGGAGNDVLDGGADSDLLAGQGGSDLLIGGTGNDTVYGDAGNDSILGNDGNDLLSGGLGNDVLLGGNGNDVLTGNEGRDTLIGGFGADHATGGDGIDFAVMGQGGPNRGGNSTANPGDFVNTVGSVIESIDETFDTTFDWEVASFGIV